MIAIKTDHELALMRAVGALAAETLVVVLGEVRPGMMTEELDNRAEAHIVSAGGRPAFKGYRGYPATICISINEQVVHGIPGKRVLRDGDIVSIDLGVEVDGFYGDVAWTVGVGTVSEVAERLMAAAKMSLFAGIEACRPGGHVLDISAAIQRTAEGRGYQVVRQFVGHGIGSALHEDPQVPNYGEPGTGAKLKQGMVFAIEPMVNAGSAEVEVLADKWTVVTADRALSAHFEHTVAVAPDGWEILTNHADLL